MTAPTPASDPHKSGWIEPVLWSLAMIVGIVAFACFNETAREVALQGVAYLFAFLSTPFVMEASAALAGLCIVLIINNRRIAKEGDGWVVMEVKEQEQKPAEKADAKHPEAS